MSGVFRNILNKSIEDFKSNFSEFFKLGLWVYLIPLLAVNLFTLFAKDSLSGQVGILLLDVLVIFTSLFYSLFMIKRLNGEKGNLMIKSWKKLPSVILFNCVYALFLMLLFLLGIIPGIIFGIFWVFGFLIFVISDKSIFESLKESKLAVKGKWWRTLWYLFLLGLIVLLFYFAIILVLYQIAILFGATFIKYSIVIIGCFISLLITMFSVNFTFRMYKDFIKNDKKKVVKEIVVKKVVAKKVLAKKSVAKKSVAKK